MKRAVAVIPARGGSKRIPRKNVRDFGGRPMIAWPLGTAIACGLFERVIVSTEDTEVAEVARRLGAEISNRPDELAGDHVNLQAVMKHEAGRLTGSDQPDYLCFILATAVFLTQEALRSGAAKMAEGHWEFALHMMPFPSPIQRAVVMTPTGGTRMIHPEHYYTRSQDLEPTFYDVGQCYWGKPTGFLTPPGADFYGEMTAVIPLDRRYAIDIDTPEDWELAEALHAFARRGS